MLGIASHSPGGLGVFEATILQAVGGDVDALLAALLMFRCIYYIAPFIVAMALLGGVEATRRWRSIREAMAAARRRAGRRWLTPGPIRVADLIQSPFAAQLVAAMPEAALIVGADGRVAVANKPAFSLLPVLKLGDPLVLALRAPDVVDAYRRVIAGGEAETVQWSERVPVERLFDVCVAPLAAPDGEVEAALVTLRDLTEIRRVERLRVDFIANASHELRTPLASLLGFIETLQGSARDDPKARDRFLVIMRDQGRRMARLIEDLLSLSRIEQKQHMRPETVVDLAQTVRGVVDSLVADGRGAGRGNPARRARAGPGEGRPRRTSARRREPDRERDQIRRATERRRRPRRGRGRRRPRRRRR